MHPYTYYAREVHRDWLAQFEREAELRRMLPERRAPRRVRIPFRSRGPHGTSVTRRVTTRAHTCL
jgi:hypothetical protein